MFVNQLVILFQFSESITFLQHYFPKRIEFLSDKDINEIIDRLEGFSKVVKLMQEFKKPIVGHNMLLDIMLLYHQFVQELPCK